MTEMSVRVAFDEAYSPHPPVVYMQLNGDSEDNVQALMRPLSPTNSSFHVFVRVEDLANPYAMVANVTLGDLAQLTEILELDRGHIRVDNAGRGGGPMATLIEVVNVIGYITTAVAGGQLVERAYDEVKYGKQREAAKDWLRGGRDDLLDPLRTYVFLPGSWGEADFTKAFALSGEPAYRLLRAAEFEYDDRNQRWWRPIGYHGTSAKIERIR
jgi:hypothetical protein